MDLEIQGWTKIIELNIQTWHNDRFQRMPGLARSELFGGFESSVARLRLSVEVADTAETYCYS